MAPPSPLIWASFFGTFWVNFSDFFFHLRLNYSNIFPKFWAHFSDFLSWIFRTCWQEKWTFQQDSNPPWFHLLPDGLKWILWRISSTFETVWSLPKSRFLPKIVLIVNFRSKCLECASFLSNAYFYQTFRKNFHQNFGVCGLIGSNWRTQIEGCVAL